MTKTYSKSRFSKEPRQRDSRSFLIGAIDIETDGFGGEYVYGTIHHETWACARGYERMSDLLDYLFSLDAKLLKDTIWFSHNGEFDWSRLIQYFHAHNEGFEIQAMEKMEGKFFQFNVKGPDGKLVTTWRDSLALWPGKLKDLLIAFAPHCPKGETPIPFDPKNEAHVRYALNDAYGLVEGLRGFDKELYRVYGVHIKGTIASTGYQALLRALPEDEVYTRVNGSIETWFRNCYYGGRVQINAKLSEYSELINSFDINSSYPAQMRLGVPGGRPRHTDIIREDVNGLYPGFYYGRVTMPDLPLPFIPHKNEHGQLSFPRAGKPFYTYLSSIEIEYLRLLGGDIDDDDPKFEGFYFPEGLCYPFNAFVDMCEHTRNANKGTSTEKVIKLIQNSVYGKFGTRPEGREVIVSFGNKVPEGYVLYIDLDTGEHIPNAFIREAARDAAYMLPHWAAWITAQARLCLDRGIRTAGAKNVLYIDTDSIKTTPEGTARMLASDLVGKVYGQFKDEGDIKRFRAIAPKVYAGYKKDETGEYAPWFAVKGIPAKQALEQFEDLHAGKEIMAEWESPNSFTTMMRTGKMSANRLRHSTDFRNVYGHEVISNHYYSRMANEDE